jgi:hypothetical protein
MERSLEIPEAIRQQVRQAEMICQSFLFGLQFVVMDTARDPGYLDNHLLSYTSQDYLQSTIALPLLIQEGIHNVCKRELRFILEMSIKLCSVQQQQYSLDVATKLNTLKATLDSTNISMQKQLDLHLLPQTELSAFYQEVGRIYGETSSYVHLTQAQILERVAMVDQGRTSGNENAADVEALNTLIARGLACSLVFLLHSVPEYVAGDLLVQSDGTSLNWYFSQSRFIANMDEQFDYKHERQSQLEEIKRRRWEGIMF